MSTPLRLPMPLRATVSMLTFAALLLSSAPSHAVDSATRGAARELGYEGVAAYQNGNYSEAADKLERAFSVLPAPSLGLWSARALEKSGKLVEASERYLEAARAPVEEGGAREVQQKAQQEAATERAALLERIPKVIVLIEGAEPTDVKVHVNGVLVKSQLFGAGRPTNPGKILVVAQLAERKVEGSVELAEGEKKSITLAFKPIASLPPVAPPPPPAPADQPPTAAAASGGNTADSSIADSGAASARWQPVAGWTAVGLGGAGLIVGGIMGGLALDKNAELRAPCRNGCPQELSGNLSNYKAYKAISAAGLIGGGILMASGLTLLLTSGKKSNQSATLSPYLGLAGAAAPAAGLSGTF